MARRINRSFSGVAGPSPSTDKPEDFAQSMVRSAPSYAQMSLESLHPADITGDTNFQWHGDSSGQSGSWVPAGGAIGAHMPMHFALPSSIADDPTSSFNTSPEGPGNPGSISRLARNSSPLSLSALRGGR